MSKPKKIKRTKRLYRRKSHPKWMGTVLFILFLIILVGLGYIVSKEWVARFGGNNEVSSLPSSSVTSSEPPAISSEESSLPVSSEPEQEQEAISIKGLRMSAADMAKTGSQLSAYLENAKTAGFNAVYMDLKNDEGIVTYDSTNELAKQYGTISKTPVALDGLIAAIKDADLFPVARISALKDPLAAHVSNQNSFGYGNSTEVNWLDDSVSNGGKPWLNPYMENTRKYISGLCKEASDRGISYIVLDNVHFPLKNTGKMGTINEFTSRDKILGQLVRECQTAVGDTTVFAAYSPSILVKFGMDPIRSMGTALSPTLDLKAIEANRKAITELLSPGAAEAYSTEEIVQAMLGEAKAVQEEGWKRLPLIPASDLETIRPILEAQGYESYLVL